MTPIQSWEDLQPGARYDLGGFALPEEEVLDFAARYDPQPFHLSQEAGEASIFGGLVASGLHTLSAAFGHLIRSGLLGEANLGGNAMELRWPSPLRPGERVAMRVEVVETRPLRSRPGVGMAKLRYLVTREADGAAVLEVLTTHFLRRRESSTST
jgi:acyl dehydratase